MESKPKLLWVSDNPRFNYVGQAILTRQILSRLGKSYEIHVGGYAKPERPQQDIGVPLPYDIHIIQRYQHDMLDKLIAALKPDVVVLSHDVFLYKGLPSIKLKYPDVKFIGWFTIDGEPLCAHWKEIFESCDLVVSPTHYGKRIIHETLFHIPCDVIPYGINHDEYRHRTDKGQVKRELAQLRVNYNIPEDEFTVIFWGHNQTKKNVAAIYEAWQIANMRNRGDAHLFLVLHSRITTAGDWKITGDWEWMMDLDDPSVSIYDGSHGDNIMARMVQLASVLAFPSMGEGFGLPVIEAMACGVVPVIVDFAGVTDFCNQKNSFPAKGVKVKGQFNVDRVLVDPDDLARKILDAYDLWKDSPEEFFRMQKAGVDTAKRFTWSTSAKLMDEAIQKVLDPTYDSKWRLTQYAEAVC